MTKRICVTGASGRAGRVTVRELLAHGYQVVATDRVMPAEDLGVRPLLADLTDYGQATEVLQGVDAVVHLANIPAPEIHTPATTFNQNMTMNFNVFTAAAQAKLERVVWASSETTLGLPFDEPPRYAPVDEDHYPVPTSTYALSKVASETVAGHIAEWSQIPFIGLRFSNILGPDDYQQFPGHWPDPAARRWNLWGYIDERDAALACRLALEAPAKGAASYVIAAADTVMDRPSAELLAEVYPGVTLTRDVGEFGTLLAIDRARAALGFTPQHSWRDHVDPQVILTMPGPGTVPSRTIPQVLADAAARDPGGVWVRSDEGTLSFAGALSQVAAAAQRLRDAAVGHGDLVMVTARTTPEYLICWLALTALGAVVVSVNPRSAPAELAGLAQQTRPRALITDAGLAALVSQAGVAGLLPLGVLDAGELAGDWAQAGPQQLGSDLLAGGVSPDDLAVLIPTSGTTGRSKLVMQTHRAYVLAGEGFPYWMELTAQDRLMTSLPLFHINAPAYSVMGSLACGAGLILLPRFSASGFLDAARRHGATEFNAIGALLEILMRQPARPGDADTPLRLCYTGPAPTRERQEEMERRLGLRIVVGYAMSESPYGLIWPHGTRPFGTLGAVRQHPVLGVINHARVADGAGREVGPGGQGELLLRNPVLTRGYYGMPAETAQAFTEDGWLHTGDLVTVDPGGLYTFVARKKEVLRRRGENLSPAEVEEVLEAHPDVLECAVVGVASELSEEEVKAFVVPAPGRRPDFADLRAHTAARLAAFKVPRYWQLIDELPRTPTARVAKHRLPAGHPPGEYDAEETG